jgi:hypothetical protein
LAGQPVTRTVEQVQVVVVLQQTPGHGVWQEPAQVNTLGVGQPASDVTLQTPVVTLQHLPRQGDGVHVPLQMKLTFAPAQFPAEEGVQEQDVRLQHTPRQGEGVQVPPQRKVWPVPAQSAGADGAQAQLEIVQQTPGQGEGLQTPPQKKVPLHVPCVDVTQVQLVQQTPGQGFGLHVLPGPWYVVPAAHPAAPENVGVHAQVGLQQAPGQGLGLHEAPSTTTLPLAQGLVLGRNVLTQACPQSPPALF